MFQDRGTGPGEVLENETISSRCTSSDSMLRPSKHDTERENCGHSSWRRVGKDMFVHVMLLDLLNNLEPD